VRRGFDVVIATQSCIMVKMAHEECPNLILVDTRLPVKEIQTAIKELKTKKGT